MSQNLILDKIKCVSILLVEARSQITSIVFRCRYLVSSVLIGNPHETICTIAINTYHMILNFYFVCVNHTSTTDVCDRGHTTIGYVWGSGQKKFDDIFEKKFQTKTERNAKNQKKKTKMRKPHTDGTSAIMI